MNLKLIVSEGGKVVLVLASLGLFWRVLELSYVIPDKTLFVALGQSVVATISLITGYWFGSSRNRDKPMDQPDGDGK
jgi:hypothetical protein